MSKANKKIDRLTTWEWLTVSNGKRTEKVKAFYTAFTERWTPVDGYIAHPLHSPYIPKEWIKSISGNDAGK